MGAKVGGSDGPAGMDEINVTPLIDIVLVLLIIFMVLTPITVEKMASNLPPNEPPDTTEPPPPDQLMVAVYDDGKISLNLKEGEDTVLMEELGARLRAKAKKTVFIDAAPNANYARVIQVIDMVREQGADTVGFAEMKDEGPARITAGQALPGAVPAGAPAAPAPG